MRDRPLIEIIVEALEAKGYVQVEPSSRSVTASTGKLQMAMSEKMTSFKLADARQRAYDGEATREDMTNLADWSWELLEEAAAVAGVRALHAPQMVGGVRCCTHCGHLSGRTVAYPCPTIKALDWGKA